MFWQARNYIKWIDLNVGIWYCEMFGQELYVRSPTHSFDQTSHPNFVSPDLLSEDRGDSGNTYLTDNQEVGIRGLAFRTSKKGSSSRPRSLSPFPKVPTSPSTILEHQNPWIDEFYVVQKRGATDLKAPKLWKGSPGYPSGLRKRNFSLSNISISLL